MISQAMVDDVLSRLSTIPTRIMSASAGWSVAQLQTSHTNVTWSAVDILAHLRASNAILAPRAYMILVLENPPLLACDERRWAEVAGYNQVDFHVSLATFTFLRAELVQMLRQVALDDWQRGGMHESRGVMRLFDVVSDLLEHEEEHCAQLEALSIIT